MSNEIIVKSVEEAVIRQRIITELRKSTLVANIDFGVVPGTDKPTLLKPGAEKIMAAMGLWPDYELIDKAIDWEDGLFYFQYRCIVRRIGSNEEIGAGIGSCNSRENKYAWRWVTLDKVPPNLDPKLLVTRPSSLFEFDFAIKKRETGGKYGKPLAYWEMFDQAIKDDKARRAKRMTAKGEAEGWEIDNTLYRIPNDEIFSLVNTIDKMAQKRALVAAVLVASGASEFFTQDVEDLPFYEPGDIIEITGQTLSIQEEREELTRQLVPSVYPTVAELANRIKAFGFENYAQMRNVLTFEQILKSLSSVESDGG